MNAGDSLPDDHRVVVYCEPGSTKEVANGERAITPQAFKPSKSDPEVSCHHWEHEPQVTKNKHVMRRIRRESDGEGSAGRAYTRRPNGRYARLKVADILKARFGILVKKTDGDYLSHCGIWGLGELAPEHQVEACRKIYREIQRVFPAVTKKQPRNDRPA